MLSRKFTAYFIVVIIVVGVRVHRGYTECLAPRLGHVTSSEQSLTVSNESCTLDVPGSTRLDTISPRRSTGIDQPLYPFQIHQTKSHRLHPASVLSRSSSICLISFQTYKRVGFALRGNRASGSFPNVPTNNDTRNYTQQNSARCSCICQGLTNPGICTSNLDHSPINNPFRPPQDLSLLIACE